MQEVQIFIVGLPYRVGTSNLEKVRCQIGYIADKNIFYYYAMST